MQEQPAFEGGSPRPEGGLDIEATNLLQMELIELSGQDAEAWIEHYSPAFRDVIEEEPSYFAELYKTDRTECIRVLKEKLSARVLH